MHTSSRNKRQGRGLHGIEDLGIVQVCGCKCRISSTARTWLGDGWRGGGRSGMFLG